MIEKFSKEEIAIIKRELGVSNESDRFRFSAYSMYGEELHSLMSDKPFNNQYNCYGGNGIYHMLSVIACCCLNLMKYKTRNKTNFWSVPNTISDNDLREYKACCDELMEVIRKYNKPYSQIEVQDEQRIDKEYCSTLRI